MARQEVNDLGLSSDRDAASEPKTQVIYDDVTILNYSLLMISPKQKQFVHTPTSLGHPRNHQFSFN